jgi:hypothetical protein
MWRPSASPMASEGGMLRPSFGMPTFFNGAFYVLYGAPTNITNSNTETSIFGGDTSITSPIVVTAGVNPYPANPGSTRAIPPSALNTLGSMFNGDFFGTLKTNGTPSLQVRLGLVNSAGTFTSIADTTSTALTAEGTACFLHINCGWSIYKTGTTGSINAWVGYEYAPTSISVYSTYTNTASIDLTQPYTLDIRATWSAADTSNTITIGHGAFELIG